MKYVLIIVIALFAAGCAEKEDEISALNERINAIHEDHIQPLWERNRELVRLAGETKQAFRDAHTDVCALRDELEKPIQKHYTKEELDVIYKDEPELGMLAKSLYGYENAYDPNSPQYRFMEVAEPNWVAAFGDTLETRILYNISKNRVMTAMNSKRLLALEDPNEVKE